MAGQNLFKARQYINIKSAYAGQSCVFISHKQQDKDAAVGVASYLKSLDINVWIDEDDELLAAAAAAQDARMLVNYIESAIIHSTHLLAVISEKTKESWWVPFEIGSAKQASLTLAYLLLEDVAYVPEYLSIVHGIKDQFELWQWADEQFGQGLSKAVKANIERRWVVPRLPLVRNDPPRFIKER